MVALARRGGAARVRRDFPARRHDISGLRGDFPPRPAGDALFRDPPLGSARFWVGGAGAMSSQIHTRSEWKYISFAKLGYFLLQYMGISRLKLGGDAMTSLNDSRLEGTIERIESASDIDEIWSALRQFCEDHGFNSMTYFATNIPSLGIYNDILLSTLPTDYIQHYIRQRYCEIDPVMLAAKSRLAPFDWADLDHSAPHIRRIRGEGRNAGKGRNAISAPMRGATGDSALLSVSSNMGDRDWGLLKRSYMRDVQIVALSAHERFLALAGATSVSRFAPRSPRARLSGEISHIAEAHLIG